MLARLQWVLPHCSKAEGGIIIGLTQHDLGVEIVHQAVHELGLYGKLVCEHPQVVRQLVMRLPEGSVRYCVLIIGFLWHADAQSRVKHRATGQRSLRSPSLSESANSHRHSAHFTTAQATCAQRSETADRRAHRDYDAQAAVLKLGPPGTPKDLLHVQHACASRQVHMSTTVYPGYPAGTRCIAVHDRRRGKHPMGLTRSRRDGRRTT